MKIAILHEMLVKLGGAEKVVESLSRIFPDADIYTLIYDDKKVGKVFSKEKVIVAKQTERIYSIFKNQRFCLPFMPRAVESFDFSKYDYVIASSSGFAHGPIVKGKTKLIVYYHSPARYLWDWTHEYKKDIGWNRGIKGFLLGKVFLELRKWDIKASQKAHISLANSNNTKARIKKYFRKDAKLLYPPVETSRFAKEICKNTLSKSDRYYIILSALTEFKKIEVAIKGFNQIKDIQLKIIGDGKYRNVLEDLVQGKNIEFLGAQYGDELVNLVQKSDGLIFPGEEDFGIVPIEVMAAGKPVFAYRGGGLLETVIEGKTGEFFDEKDGGDFVEKFEKFDKNNSKGKYTTKDCKNQAEKFSEQAFSRKIKSFVSS